MKIYIRDRGEFIYNNCEGYTLDVGCGDLHPWALTEFNRLPDVCCDIVEHVVNTPYFSGKVSELCTFTLCDAHHLPFKSNTFDTVALTDVLEHVKNPRVCIKEALRAGRKLVLTVPSERGHKSPYQVYHIPDRETLTEWLQGFYYKIYETKTKFWTGFCVVAWRM